MAVTDQGLLAGGAMGVGDGDCPIKSSSCSGIEDTATSDWLLGLGTLPFATTTSVAAGCDKVGSKDSCLLFPLRAALTG